MLHKIGLSSFGSGREFVDERILGGFLKDDEFGLGDRHALSLEQQVAEIFVTAAPSKESFDVAVDSFHHSEAYFRATVIAPIIPQSGVVTLFGYGASAQVERGHLILNDGIGMNRRQGRFARVRHGLKRLVVIGSNGMVTFEALRWMAVQDVAFLLLDRDGSVLAVSGPVGPSDARLRRAQSLAHHSGVALQIAGQLISQKLEGQQRVARDILRDLAVAQTIASFRGSLEYAESTQDIRQIESQAAQSYWSVWRDLPVDFPTADLNRVPQHWKTFGTRKSPITDSPRLAVNPANAMLNYLYALLESEARLAAAAAALDPGIGFLHVDTDARDSLACDLMETCRPHVDAFLLEWIMSQPLRREWFFEQRDGSCRLMAPFAVRLSESAPAWRQLLAPITDWVSRVLSCKVPICTEELVKAAQKGRLASHGSEAEAKRAENRRRHAAALRAWRPSDQPACLDEETYLRKIQPRLSSLTVH